MEQKDEWCARNNIDSRCSVCNLAMWWLKMAGKIRPTKSALLSQWHDSINKHQFFFKATRLIEYMQGDPFTSDSGLQMHFLLVVTLASFESDVPGPRELPRKATSYLRFSVTCQNVLTWRRSKRQVKRGGEKDSVNGCWKHTASLLYTDYIRPAKVLFCFCVG